jgi:hypothetical protein
LPTRLERHQFLTGGGVIPAMTAGRSTRRSFLARSAATGVAVGAGGFAMPYGSAGRRALASSGGGTWLPGDLHTHSVYSHDVYGGPTDDNTGTDEAYTLGLPVTGKFAEGRERGLRFMAVTDHNDVRSVPELGGASGSLIAIPAYEHSIRGHAQMLGATHLYDAGDQAADRINAMAGALRAAGGVFQANHPAYKLALDAEFHPCSNAGCADCRAINWTYGFDVPPDTIEVWNPSVARSDVSETYWECWLDRGARIGGTGGSDSHWLSLHAIAGPGQPTTWVYAGEATPAGVLQGLREGRTTVSGQSPELGGARLLLSAPREGMIGDTVAPGTKMRVTAPGLQVPAVVRVRANGHQVLERELEPGGAVTFRAPREAGWLRAILLARASLPVSTTTELGDPTPQRDGMPLLALSSPMYLARPQLARPPSRAASTQRYA